MKTMHPDDPLALRFPRTAREAFGTNYYEEKPNRDGLWFIGSVAFLLVFAVVLVWLRS